MKTLNELSDEDRDELGRTIAEAVMKFIPPDDSGRKCAFVVLVSPGTTGTVMYASNVHPDDGLSIINEAAVMLKPENRVEEVREFPV